MESCHINRFCSMQIIAQRYEKKIDYVYICRVERRFHFLAFKA